MEEKIEKLGNLWEYSDLSYVDVVAAVCREAISEIKSLQADNERLQNEKAEMGAEFAKLKEELKRNQNGTMQQNLQKMGKKWWFGTNISDTVITIVCGKS